jgi:hypothetical protein
MKEKRFFASLHSDLNLPFEVSKYWKNAIKKRAIPIKPEFE